MLESETEQPPLFNSPTDLEFKIKPPKDFFVSSGGIDDPDYDLYQFSDIEMVTVQRYESLKDVLALSPKPPTVLSMTWNRRESWREIPIKDPLVQHAAWAYLLPGPAAEGNDRKFKDGCCGFLGYLVNEVVLGCCIRRLFGGDKTSSDDNNCGDDKVD